RARAADFAKWSALGIQGWSFDDVLASYKAVENSPDGDDHYRGRSGPLPIRIRRPDELTPLLNASSMRRPIRVSGSSETKTYDKSAAVRAHEKQQTLPRRSFFGKDTTERLHIFNVLQTRFSPTEALFSGKLSYTDIANGCRASL